MANSLRNNKLIFQVEKVEKDGENKVIKWGCLQTMITNQIKTPKSNIFSLF